MYCMPAMQYTSLPISSSRQVTTFKNSVKYEVFNYFRIIDICLNNNIELSYSLPGIACSTLIPKLFVFTLVIVIRLVLVITLC